MFQSEEYPNGYPVMFWVHGGGFVLGGTEEYGMDGINEYMVTKDVIVVTIQYRLSILGNVVSMYWIVQHFAALCYIVSYLEKLLYEKNVLW